MSLEVNRRQTAENVLYEGCFVCDISKVEAERRKLMLSDESYEYHQAACRFVRQAGGLDSTVEKIVYHQKCYIK